MFTVKTSPPNPSLYDAPSPSQSPLPSFLYALFGPYSLYYIPNETSLQQQQQQISEITTENKKMAAGAGAGGGKSDDFQPFPVKDQLPGVDFCLSSSPPWRMINTSTLAFISWLSRYFPPYSLVFYHFFCTLRTPHRTG